MVMTTTVQANRVFQKANRSTQRYRLFYGSAGSGKSYNIAQDFILKLSDPYYKGANLLVVRRVAESNAVSTFSELWKAIMRIFGPEWAKFWEVIPSRNTMTCRITGNEILFGGMLDDKQKEKTKSITAKNGSITWIWIEEATELLETQVDVLDDRLRGQLDNSHLYFQITFSFNPVSVHHWIKHKYIDAVRNDVYLCHSTYLDNRFIDPSYHQRMERRKLEDPEGYRVYGEGQWGELGGLVLHNYVVHDFITEYLEQAQVSDYTGMFDYMVLAQDFGFNHANAILEVGFKDGDLYVCQELVLFEKETNEIIQEAEGRFNRRLRMWCDSAEPDRIKQWSKAGYRALPVKKFAGSVKAQIDHLKQRKIHIHPSCVAVAKEISQWKYAKNRITGLYEEEPVNFNDDCMAALRYAISDEMKDHMKVLKPRRVSKWDLLKG